MKNRRKRNRAARWVTVWAVWHKRGKRYIRRKDGKPFKFPVG